MVDSSSAPGHERRDLFVLSGGGSRGAAHIGMLRALLGAGVTPDVIVGGSVGALNGVFLATDPTLQRVEELADRWMGMNRKSITGSRRTIASNVVRRRPYLFSSDALRSLITAWVGVERLESLAVPTRVATTDLASGRPIHHDAGVLADILAASAALPAVFPPVLLNGTAHVDAGIAENLPVSAAVGLAAPGDRVWLLDVTKRAQMRTLRTPIDVLIAALAGSITNRPTPVFEAGVELVTIKLDEEYECGSVFDFTNTGTLFRLGEETATRALLSSEALT